MDSDIDLEGPDLPIANEANKLLDETVRKKQKNINRLQAQIDEHKERVQTIKDHLANVRQELQLSEALHEARKNDVETEHHLMQVYDREEGRLKGEIKRLQLHQEELRERMNTHENTLFRANKSMEETRKRMNWDQQTLEAWLEESARKDEDALTIEKYARADEGRIKEMMLREEQLRDTAVKRRKMLDGETTGTLTAQIELDKTAQVFRQAHQEREELIAQWEQIIQWMRKRDEDMDHTATDLARLHAEVRAKRDNIQEKEEFLRQEKSQNKEMEKKINFSERQCAQVRLDYQESEGARLQLTDELETLKYSVDRVAADLESLRNESHQLSSYLKDRKKRMETIQHQRKIMQEELKKTTHKSLTSEERAYQMDLLLSEEEAKLKMLEKELEVQREKQFKRLQDLHDAKQKEGNLQREVEGACVAISNLSSKQNKLDEEVLKQKELIYTQDFQLQQLEHKLRRLKGERTEDETANLTKKIKHLEGEWDRQRHSEQVLNTQLKRLQDDLRRMTRQLERGHKDKHILTGKIDELNLHIDSTQRELKRIVATKQDLMVDENIIKLEVKRLRDTLFHRSDDVLSLSKQKLQLETAMIERNKEIGIHKDMMKAQIRASESEKQTVSSELHECLAKVGRLKKRYEILMVSMAPPEGEEEHSQAYYVIKAAQEREELQREGDMLDSKIEKAEKEIRALENTLAVMNVKNERFRKTLQKADPAGDEAVELENLEGQWRAATEKLRYKKKQMKQIEGDARSAVDMLAAASGEEEHCNNLLQEKKELLAALSREAGELRVKKERASKQCTKTVKEIRAKKKVSGKTELEEDIELRELRDFNSSAVQQLGSLGQTDPQLASTIGLLLSQVGLPPPASPTASTARSTPLSTPSSARSSVTGRSSVSQGSTPRYTPTSTQLTTKMVDIGEMALSGSAASTPRTGASPLSSTSSLGSRRGQKRQAGSHPSSTPSSQSGSQASSSADLTVRPS